MDRLRVHLCQANKVIRARIGPQQRGNFHAGWPGTGCDNHRPSAPAPRLRLSGAGPGVRGGKNSPERPGRSPAKSHPAPARWQSARSRARYLRAMAGQNDGAAEGRAPSRQSAKGSFEEDFHPRLPLGPFSLQICQRHLRRLAALEDLFEETHRPCPFRHRRGAAKTQTAPHARAAHRPLRQNLPTAARLFRASAGKKHPPGLHFPFVLSIELSRSKPRAPKKSFASRQLLPGVKNSSPRPHEHTHLTRLQQRFSQDTLLSTPNRYRI